MHKEQTKILGWFFLLAFLERASASKGAWGIGERPLGSRLSLSASSTGSSELCLDGWTSPSIRIETAAANRPPAGQGSPVRKRRILAKRDSYSSSCSRRRGTRIGQDYNSCCDASLSTKAAPDVTAMASPIVPLTVSLDDQTGEEFADPETMFKFMLSGLKVAYNDKNDWIEWKEHSSTKKLMEEHNNNERAILEQGEVLVYIGKSKKEGHGSKLPIIRTKSILPLSAKEMADLLMDSSKVKIYNKLSVGRTDLRTLGEGTKVVCNLTKPPIAKSNMVSCTMMHSRQLSDTEHIVVSRAAPGMIDEEISDLPRNDILLGVNYLEDKGPNKCVMTAVTHVYSPALPTILAKKLGVSSAINFVKDIRSSCIGEGN